MSTTQQMPAQGSDWARCQTLADVPAVDEALRAFLDDPHNDSGVFVVQAVLEAAAPAAKSLFWYRPRSDGQGFDGPIHDSVIEEVRKRSGVWVPLYTHPSDDDLRETSLRRELAEAREEIEIDNKLLAELDALVRMIPACPDHGDQCLPHAREWVAKAVAAAAAAPGPREAEAPLNMTDMIEMARLFSGENEYRDGEFKRAWFTPTQLAVFLKGFAGVRLEGGAA